MDYYVVCVDSKWIRNAEILDTDGLSDDDLVDIYLYDEEYERRWHTMEPMPFIEVVKAETEEKACEIAAGSTGHDPRCLYAIKIDI